VSLLQDRVALVTGAAVGIGRGIADLFAQEGARVYLLDRDESGVTAAADAIRSQGGEAFAFRADVSQPDSIVPVIADAQGRFGRVDILVNNAGIYPRRLFVEMTEAEWDEMQAVNVKGVYHLTKAALPLMIEKRYGKIVNISSVTFFMGYPKLTHYVASKGALIGFTRALAREVGEHNVYINAVTPGAIQTEGEKIHANPADLEKILDEQCLKRRMQPLDVARACLFLASELSVSRFNPGGRTAAL
jgi:3-oxoacyl-[acyl-carrier protein] reductase